MPTVTLQAAQRYLDSALTGDGVSYAYRPGEGPSHVMTAEALLCRMYLGADLRDADVREGLAQMAQQHPPRREETNVYYWYYATQALHHAGGPTWDEWNRALRDVLVQLQETTGHAAGSWSPRGPHTEAGGRLYMTALAVCTLEVYYRHAPIFRRIRFECKSTGLHQRVQMEMVLAQLSAVIAGADRPHALARGGTDGDRHGLGHRLLADSIDHNLQRAVNALVQQTGHSAAQRRTKSIRRGCLQVLVARSDLAAAAPRRPETA